MRTDQRARLDWTGQGVPVSTRFDDPYFSLQDGLAETRHVFLDGNELPDRFAPGFHIAELGFGTGLGFLTALAAWRDCGQPGALHFTSFEAFPISEEEMRRALSVFPEAAALAGPLLQGWAEGQTLIRAPDFELNIVLGDARETLRDWTGRADAWFLDGFSPAKNPELWEDTLMAEVGRHTQPGGTFATYTAAGHVRRALTAAGFVVTRQPGFGRKRHMTTGVLP